MNDDDDRSVLDDELRRLFADERLTLPVAMGAEQAVVAGAQRKRRQRLTVAAAGGVLAVAAVVFAGVGLTGMVRGPDKVAVADSRPPSVTLTTTSPTATPQQAGSDTFGPYGIGELRLGMPMAQAIATLRQSGYAVGNKTSAGCQTLTATVSAAMPRDGSGAGIPSTVAPLPTVDSAMGALPPTATAVVPPGKRRPATINVTVSSRDGVVVLGGGGFLRTPEGLGVGSQAAEVYKIYRPTLVDQQKAPVVQAKVPGNPNAFYTFYLDSTSTVVSMSLSSAAGMQRC